MRHSTPLALLLAAGLVAGCGTDRPKLPSLPAAFATLPLPPSPEFLGQSGSEDALMFTFRTPVPADTIADYYKRLFARDSSYKVLGVTPGAPGEWAFYVEFRERPLWVRVRPEAGGEGAVVELTGAVIDRADSTSRSATADSAALDSARAPRERAPGHP